MAVRNEFPHEHTSRTVCAHRGGIDKDRYIFVTTHHDEAGSGNVDPATGQAILSEMIKVLGENKGLYVLI